MPIPSTINTPGNIINLRNQKKIPANVTRRLNALLENESNNLPSITYPDTVIGNTRIFKSTRIGNKLTQNKINSKKYILDCINMLKKIIYEFSYDNETLYMSLNFLDRYFALQQVKNPRRSTFLVVALASLFIAGKIVEEAREPLAPELVTFGNEVWGNGNCTVKQLFVKLN